MRNFAQFGNNTGEQITEDIHLFNTDCAFLINIKISNYFYFINGGFLGVIFIFLDAKKWIE